MNKDYSLCLKIQEDDTLQGYYIFALDFMTFVVQQFEKLTLENILLLIQYSTKQPRLEMCCCLINALMKAMTTRKLLNSEQALHLYAHAKFIVEEDPRWKFVRKDLQRLCNARL